MRHQEIKKKTNEGLADMADLVERDHEVQMARSDLYKIAKYAIKLHEMLKTVSEAEGIEGWQQSKITKAADYIGSVYHSLDYEMKFAEQKVKEAKRTSYKDGLTTMLEAKTSNGRKALIYATCSVNYNNPGVGEAALKVLTHLGVSVKADYPGC